jgi:hypothetical protein
MAAPFDEEAEAIARAAQREALSEAAEAERELDAAFADTANDIRDKLRADPDNANAVRPAIERGFQRTAFKRRKIIAKVIESGAKKGSKAVRKTFRAQYGNDVTQAQLRTSKKALTEAADRIAGRVTVDHVALSKRIRRWDSEIGGEMAAEVERGIKARKGIEQIAKRIEKLDDVTEGLPQYLQRVEELARAGSPELKKVAKRYLARAKESLGVMRDGKLAASPYSLRSPTQKFLRDIQKAGMDGIDRAVREYVKERAAWRARVIARHETVEAMSKSYVENAKRKPGVWAFEWRLSSSHSVPDECDIYARANVHGLGSGKYPAEKLPRRHPGCVCCVVAVMDARHFERQEGGPTAREEYADRKSPGALQWLRQNDATAAKILGPTRHELLHRGVNVLDETGKPLPVGELLGARNAAE